MLEISPGIFQWTAPHPTYRTTAEEIVSYALVDGDALALVDPQLPPDRDPRRPHLLARLDELAASAQRFELLITIPYHTRSAESLYERYWSALQTRIWGPAGVSKRLTRGAPLQVIPMRTTGSVVEIADGTAFALTIGNPRRSEFPLYFPRLRTVVFGDAIVGTAKGPRFWSQSATTSPEWYRDVFAPTLRCLLNYEIDHLLVTHGPSVIGEGRRALEECLVAPPVRSY